MAISHVCNSCGVDLARVEPRLDRALNLLVVVCPGCAHAVVRRRHPVQELWRCARRVDVALSILFVQALIAAGLLGTITAMTSSLAFRADGERVTPVAFLLGAFDEQAPGISRSNHAIRYRDGRDAEVIIVAVFAALSGIWLTATYAHLRFLRRWLLWGGLVIGCASLVWVVWGYQKSIAVLLGRPRFAEPVDLSLWAQHLSMQGGALLVMLLASPLGIPARWLLRTMRGTMWKRQLRRARYARGRTE
ncbi:MAG: hypothetical protein H6813_05310 [Phycisphaeraceae bacterium]|nr:hypothetical protein [Phycisphaeraceae bacterium]MCB9847802.1 hypothetical protein [Phycisphaeraceae bacterium]